MSWYYSIINICRKYCFCGSNYDENLSFSSLSFYDSDTNEPEDLRYTIFKVSSFNSL